LALAFINDFVPPIEKIMKKNIGTPDRLLRLAMAILLLVLAYWYASWLLALIGLFTLYEAAAGWCVLYQFLGKSSCPIDKNK